MHRWDARRSNKQMHGLRGPLRGRLISYGYAAIFAKNKHPKSMGLTHNNWPTRMTLGLHDITEMGHFANRPTVRQESTVRQERERFLQWGKKGKDPGATLLYTGGLWGSKGRSEREVQLMAQRP